VVVNGVAYLQDGASNVIAVQSSTGRVLWSHQYNSPDYGPNGVTIANGKIYGVTATGVFALDAGTGKQVWYDTNLATGDQDDQLALDGKLQLTTPYTLYPGEAGGVETNMAAADGVVYVPVVDLPSAYTTAAERVGKAAFGQGIGEMVAIDLATGRQVWATKLAQIPLGGATVANDLVFTTTLTGDVIALSRKDGSIVWTSRLPAGSNATLAISGGTLLAGAGLPLTTTQHAVVVAYQLGAS
jgi:outer membrane protein assembly factor BamB